VRDAVAENACLQGVHVKPEPKLIYATNLSKEQMMLNTTGVVVGHGKGDVHVGDDGLDTP
jgi:hypothetical protein